MKGRKIITPSGKQVRPMTASIRKSMFELLEEVLPGTVVYDIFAGSGILGFEALSREARKVYFVEREKKHCFLLKRNLLSCGVSEKGTVLCLDFLRLVRLPSDLEKPDVAFFDPPFTLDCSWVLGKIVYLKDFFQHTLLVIRYPEHQNPFQGASCFERKDLRKYGESMVFFGYLHEMNC